MYGQEFLGARSRLSAWTFSHLNLRCRIDAHHMHMSSEILDLVGGLSSEFLNLLSFRKNLEKVCKVGEHGMQWRCIRTEQA